MNAETETRATKITQVNAPEEKSNPLLPVRFNTEKDAEFRTYYADGAWGMVNNSGTIILSFYVERPPLPKSVIYQQNEKGEVTLSNPEDGPIESAKELIGVRDYQAAVALTLSTAHQIHAVLGNFIRIAEAMAKGENPYE